MHQLNIPKNKAIDYGSRKWQNSKRSRTSRNFLNKTFEYLNREKIYSKLRYTIYMQCLNYRKSYILFIISNKFWHNIVWKFSSILVGIAMGLWLTLDERAPFSQPTYAHFPSASIKAFQEKTSNCSLWKFCANFLNTKIRRLFKTHESLELFHWCGKYVECLGMGARVSDSIAFIPDSWGDT